MANATSISELIAAVAKEDLPLKEKCGRAAEAVYSACGAKISVCKLFGPRWSYVGGWKGAVSPDLREKIDADYGIIAENLEKDSVIYSQIVSGIRDILKIS